MSIAVRCACGARFAAPQSFEGKQVKCPQCGKPVRVDVAVPAHTHTHTHTHTKTASGAADAPPLGLKCRCGKPLQVPRKLAGKSVKCPSCGEAVRVPVPAKAAAVAAASVGDLLDEVELNLSKTGRRCPECRQDMQLDDVICVNCGYNTETGKKIRVKKAEPGNRFGNIVLQDDAAVAHTKMPPDVASLVKLLNQAGILAVLMAVGIVAFLGYQRMQADPQLGSDAFVAALAGPGLYVLGAVVLLVVVPGAIAANLVQNGSPAGRILSLVVGFVSLLGFPLVTLIGVMIVKSALSDAVQRHCR
jgi:hypothetical protein